MKRNMDLIRELLLRLEQEESTECTLEALLRKDYSEDQIGYHNYLIVDAGLAAGIDTTHMGNRIVQHQLNHLTWAGQEFLDAARDDGRWKRASNLGRAVGGVSLAVLQQVLIKLALEGITVSQ